VKKSSIGKQLSSSCFLWLKNADCLSFVMLIMRVFCQQVFFICVIIIFRDPDGLVPGLPAMTLSQMNMFNLSCHLTMMANETGKQSYSSALCSVLCHLATKLIFSDHYTELPPFFHCDTLIRSIAKGITEENNYCVCLGLISFNCF